MANEAEAIQPFRIDVPQEQLDDLEQRLARIRWTDELPDAGDDYGVPLGRLKEVVGYWRTEYDWRSWEARLNRYPQFTTVIDGQNIHFLHIRSEHQDATPLILTHGWPMSVVEFLDVIEPLTAPERPQDAFHLVIPHLPGFGFSGPTAERGWNRYRTARAWAELMRRLGYQRYGAHGNDIGSHVSPELGRIAPEQVIGAHVTQIFSFPSGDPAELAGLGEEDLGRIRFLEWFMANKGAFNKLQSTEPQTLAHALADSPVGQLAWSLQLFGDAVSRDYTLTNVMVHWLTNTAASAARFYYEDAHAEAPAEPTTVPLGLANFAYDFQAIRRLADRDHKNIVSWHTYDQGGHFSAHDATDLLVEDIRGFFRGLR
jgi:pimeloyl-ACP methyl ester carboxylesterase